MQSEVIVLSIVIETAIGLALVFYFMALVCSTITEAIANALKKRAKYLLRGLREMLDDPPDAGAGASDVSAIARITADQKAYERALESNATTTAPTPGPNQEPPTPSSPAWDPWTSTLMGHPLIRPFKETRSSRKKSRNPSYLPARAFATALLDMIVPDSQGQTTLATVRAQVVALDPATPFKGALISMLKHTEEDVKEFMTSLEQWYDDQMDRISGSYKRWAKRWLIGLALVLVSVAGIDAISIGRSLYEDAPLRSAVVAAASNERLCEQRESFEETRQCVAEALTELEASSGLPIGWTATTTPTTFSGWLLKALGLAITAAAATLGAPFWYDALNRFGSMRNTGPKPKPTTP